MIDSNIVLSFALILAVGVMIYLFFRFNKLKGMMSAEYSKLLTLKKSSETRLGLIGENLAPYIEEWPFEDPREFRLVSSPIDGINFGRDKITIVEIKTGKSRLSRGQKHIKELVRQGKVEFLEFRVGADGVDIKTTEKE